MSEEIINSLQEEITNYKNLKKEKEDLEEKLRLKVFPDYFLNTWISSYGSDSIREGSDMVAVIDEIIDEEDSEDSRSVKEKMKDIIEKNIMKNLTKSPRTSIYNFDYYTDENLDVDIYTLTYTWKNRDIVATYNDAAHGDNSSETIYINGKALNMDTMDIECDKGELILTDIFFDDAKRICEEGDYLDKYLKYSN